MKKSDWLIVKKVAIFGGIGLAAAAVVTVVVLLLLKKRGPTICDVNGRVSLYAFIVNPGGHTDIFTTNQHGDDIIQNNGNPVVTLCSTKGNGRVPLYKYHKIGGDTADYRWGTSSIAPDNFEVMNNGDPYGYLFDSLYPSVKDQLVAVNEFTADLNGGVTTVGIVGSQTNTATYGAVTYTKTKLLGYGILLA